MSSETLSTNTSGILEDSLILNTKRKPIKTERYEPELEPIRKRVPKPPELTDPSASPVKSVKNTNNNSSSIRNTESASSGNGNGNNNNNLRKNAPKTLSKVNTTPNSTTQSHSSTTSSNNGTPLQNISLYEALQQSRKERFNEELKLLPEILHDSTRKSDFIRTELIDPCEKYIDSLKPRRVRHAKSKAQQLLDLKNGKLDLYSPESIFANIPLSSVVNEKNFRKLPAYLQYELTKLLPKCDQITLPNGALVPSDTAFNNSNMSHRIAQFTTRMQEGNLTYEHRNRTVRELERARKLVDPFKIKHFEPFGPEPECLQSEEEKIEQITEQLMTVVKQHEICKVITSEKIPVLPERAYLPSGTNSESSIDLDSSKCFDLFARWDRELFTLKATVDKEEAEKNQKIKVIPFKAPSRYNTPHINKLPINKTPTLTGGALSSTLNSGTKLKTTTTPLALGNKHLRTLKVFHHHTPQRRPEIIKLCLQPGSDMKQKLVLTPDPITKPIVKMTVPQFISQGNAILKANFLDTHLPVPIIPMQKNFWDMYLQSLQNVFCILQLYFQKAETFTSVMQLRIMGNLLMPTVISILDTCKLALDPVRNRQENDRQILRVMFSQQFSFRKTIPAEVPAFMDKLDTDVSYPETPTNPDYCARIVLSLKTKFDLLNELCEKNVMPAFKVAGEIAPAENFRLLSELRTFAQSIRQMFDANHLQKQIPLFVKEIFSSEQSSEIYFDDNLVE